MMVRKMTIRRLFLMKCIYIALALSICPALMGMERPPQWPQPAQAQSKFKFDKKKVKECTICVENMMPGESYSCFPCQHAMHYECFKTFSRSATRNHCPECRAYLPEQLLATLRTKASGAIEGQSNAQANQEVGFFRRMMLMLSNSENKAAEQPTPEQKIKNLTDALFEAQKRITLNQEQIGQLIRQKAQLEGKLQETNREYQNFRLNKPELVRLESYKKNLESLASKNQALEVDIANANRRIDALLFANHNLRGQIDILRSESENLRNSLQRKTRILNQQIEAHDALRRKVVYAAALGSGIGGGILASRYIKSYPKLAGLLSGASLLAATYWAGSIYCDDLLRWDRNNAI